MSTIPGIIVILFLLYILAGEAYWRYAHWLYPDLEFFIKESADARVEEMRRNGDLDEEEDDEHRIQMPTILIENMLHIAFIAKWPWQKTRLIFLAREMEKDRPILKEDIGIGVRLTVEELEITAVGLDEDEAYDKLCLAVFEHFLEIARKL